MGHVYWWWAVFSLTDILAPWPLHYPSHVDLHTGLATGPPAPAERQILCLLCSPCREQAHSSCLINSLDFSVHHGDGAAYPFLNPLCAPQGSCLGHATSCTGVGGGEGEGARGRRHPVTSCLATPGPPCVHPAPANSVCPPVRWVQNLENGVFGSVSLRWRPPVFHLRSGAATSLPGPGARPRPGAQRCRLTCPAPPAPPQAPRPVSRLRVMEGVGPLTAKAELTLCWSH